MKNHGAEPGLPAADSVAPASGLQGSMGDRGCAVRDCAPRTELREHGLRSAPATIRGLTLIEVIGVVAILALIAAALIPKIIKRVDEGYIGREIADLNTIGDAYVQACLVNKRIPGAVSNDWATNVANRISMPLNRVLKTARNTSRVFLVNSQLGFGGAGLPYLQSAVGTPVPTNAQVLVASSLSTTLTNDFATLWAAADTDDLHVKRIDLTSLFHQLILIDHDTANLALYSIDNPSITNAVPTDGMGKNAYYLQSTLLGLHATNGSIQVMYVINRSGSFMFEAGAWGGGPASGNVDPLADQFAAAAGSFYTAAVNPSAGQGVTPYSALLSVYTFMFDYSLWATECPHFDDHGSSSNPEITLLTDSGGNSGGHIKVFTGELVK